MVLADDPVALSADDVVLEGWGLFEHGAYGGDVCFIEPEITFLLLCAGLGDEPEGFVGWCQSAQCRERIFGLRMRDRLAQGLPPPQRAYRILAQRGAALDDAFKDGAVLM